MNFAIFDPLLNAGLSQYDNIQIIEQRRIHMNPGHQNQMTISRNISKSNSSAIANSKEHRRPDQVVTDEALIWALSYCQYREHSLSRSTYFECQNKTWETKACFV